MTYYDNNNITGQQFPYSDRMNSFLNGNIPIESINGTPTSNGIPLSQQQQSSSSQQQTYSDILDPMPEKMYPIPHGGDKISQGVYVIPEGGYQFPMPGYQIPKSVSLQALGRDYFNYPDQYAIVGGGIAPKEDPYLDRDPSEYNSYSLIYQSLHQFIDQIRYIKDQLFRDNASLFNLSPQNVSDIFFMTLMELFRSPHIKNRINAIPNLPGYVEWVQTLPRHVDNMQPIQLLTGEYLGYNISRNYIISQYSTIMPIEFVDIVNEFVSIFAAVQEPEQWNFKNPNRGKRASWEPQSGLVNIYRNILKMYEDQGVYPQETLFNFVMRQFFPERRRVYYV